MSVAATGNFEMTTTLNNPAPWELSLKVVLKVLMVPVNTVRPKSYSH
jgi:hypothetical protein